MGYDEELADRVREVLDARDGLSEKPMFGGMAFFLGGNMAVCVSNKGGLLVRVAPEQTEEMTGREGASPMLMSGREAKGWVRVTDEAVRPDGDLRRWVGIGVARAESLPPK